MIKSFLAIACLFVFGAWMYLKKGTSKMDNEYVYEVLAENGNTPTLHAINKLDTSKVRMGKEIVISGQTIGPNGKKNSRQSNFFTCIDCHNVKNEEKNLANPNPEDRLDYCVSNGLPFLQGTTLFGVVNRETWYNDDYLSKYGDLVKPSRDTLTNAIQLCATQCSQGRAFTEWELDAVLHYLHSISYKVSDLDLAENDLKKKNGKELVNFIKSKYSPKSAATFLYPPNSAERAMGINGNPENGERIYKASCLHCHKDRGVTNFILDNEKSTFKHLKSHLGYDVNKSVYYISRKGTYSKNGYKPYMPNYTEERLSKNQLEDLVAFINKMAVK